MKKRLFSVMALVLAFALVFTGLGKTTKAEAHGFFHHYYHDHNHDNNIRKTTITVKFQMDGKDVLEPIKADAEWDPDYNWHRYGMKKGAYITEITLPTTFETIPEGKELLGWCFDSWSGDGEYASLKQVTIHAYSNYENPVFVGEAKLGDAQEQYTVEYYVNGELYTSLTPEFAENGYYELKNLECEDVPEGKAFKHWLIKSAKFGAYVMTGEKDIVSKIDFWKYNNGGYYLIIDAVFEDAYTFQFYDAYGNPIEAEGYSGVIRESEFTEGKKTIDFPADPECDDYMVFTGWRYKDTVCDGETVELNVEDADENKTFNFYGIGKYVVVFEGLDPILAEQNENVDIPQSTPIVGENQVLVGWENSGTVTTLSELLRIDGAMERDDQGRIFFKAVIDNIKNSDDNNKLNDYIPVVIQQVVVEEKIEEIETPEIPEAPAEEKEEEKAPEKVEEVEVPEVVETPQGDLPKTGAVPATAFFGIGAACIALGGVLLALRRRSF